VNIDFSKHLKAQNLIFRGLIVVIFFTISSIKSQHMKNEENSNFYCDVTGICGSGEVVNQQQLNQTNTTIPKVKLIYYYDALCGWCYGFSPVMSKLKKYYGDKLDFDVVSGGLFLNERAGFVNDVAPHIKSGAYKSVEGLTGVKFGKPFLDDVFGAGKMTLNSLPPTIALCIVREAFPEKELEFAETLLHAVYFDGIDPIDIEAYVTYVEKLGFERNEFLLKMKAPKYKKLAEKEFVKYIDSQYSGMPSLVLEIDGKELPLTRGYTNFENLKSQLDTYFNN